MRSNGVGIAEMGLKKGPWTAAEDAILIDYVRRHGEGNWNAVQKNSGLMRCGKSCRLRWANHLRPNLKKGSFTPEEERLIIELHAKLGNKWARMAAQLPGRTDNEIKNYWNTRIKRRQRAGLPIYPQEFREEGGAAAFHLQQRQQGQQFHQFPGRKRAGSYLSGYLDSPSQRQKPDSNLSALGALNFSSPTAMNSSLPVPTIQSAFYSNNSGCPQFGYNNAGYMMPVNSQFGSSPNLNLYNPNFAPAAQLAAAAPSTFHFNSGSDPGLSYSSLLMGAGPSDYVPELKVELPSSQTLHPQPTTPANSSSSGGGVCFKNGELDPERPRGNSGLLDDVLLESRVLTRKNGGEESEGKDDKGKKVVGAEEEKEDCCELGGGGDDGSGGATAENQSDDQSSSQSSIGIKRSATEEHLEVEEMSSMDDDLLSLLNNFPTSMPLPDWYRGGGGSSLSNGSSSDVAGRETAAGAGQNGSSPGVELGWTLGSGYWNNMPGICYEGKSN